MSDIEINVNNSKLVSGNTEIPVFKVANKVEEVDGTISELTSETGDISSTVNQDCIEIEINGLKSLSSFIGLNDTPLYYEDGKFFKVDGSKLVYADIQWKDIAGDMSKNPSAVEEVKKIVEAETESYVKSNIEAHNTSVEAHPYIQNIIQENKEDIEDKLTLAKTDLQQNINTVQTNLDNTNKTVSDNYTTLDTKINNLDTTLSQEISQEISDREDADESLQEQITANHNNFDNYRTSVNQDTIDNTIKQSITNETTRATGIESGLQTDIDTINTKIPTQASSTNQLADKDFVNSSIATETANFVGTFNTLAELEAVQNPTNNDYGFVQETDELGNKVYNRYKYSSKDKSWKFEYSLNNSSFTAEQWNAINSGATTELINKITTNEKSISDEVTRATNAESNLNTKIESETTRATNIESGLRTDVDTKITYSYLGENGKISI